MNFLIIKKENIHHQKTGFVALISVIIISFVLLSVATTLTFTGFFTRFDILDSEYKILGEDIALGCIESARLILSQDNDYTGDVSMPFDLVVSPNDFCKIINSETIVAHSEVNRTHTYYLVKLDDSLSKFPINNFTECIKIDLSNPNNPICQT
jgi:hypothetical protein